MNLSFIYLIRPVRLLQLRERIAFIVYVINIIAQIFVVIWMYGTRRDETLLTSAKMAEERANRLSDILQDAPYWQGKTNQTIIPCGWSGIPEDFVHWIVRQNKFVSLAFLSSSFQSFALSLFVFSARSPDSFASRNLYCLRDVVSHVNRGSIPIPNRIEPTGQSENKSADAKREIKRTRNIQI